MDRTKDEIEVDNILSKNGKVKYQDLNPIAKATWDAYRRGFLEARKTKIEKLDVCESCWSYHITDPNCKCSYGKHKTIKLEFEVCSCCENIISDGQPEETEFNKNQLTKNQ